MNLIESPLLDSSIYVKKKGSHSPKYILSIYMVTTPSLLAHGNINIYLTSENNYHDILRTQVMYVYASLESNF